MASCDKQNASQETVGESKNSATADVIDNIMTRTSIRQYTDNAIAADTLETILKAGFAAPSAMNKQPWEFIVVTERTMLDSLAAVHPYSRLQSAAAAILVCGNMKKAIEGEGRGYWIQDCSAASENILLAAHAFGLGAVWCGVYPNNNVLPGVKEVLGLPEYITPLNIIALGFPAENPDPKDKWNPEAIHYQKW